MAGSTLVALALTIGAYLFGVWVQGKVRAAWASPVLIAIVLIGLALRGLRVPYATYFSGAQGIHFLLGPATVALAVPLVRAMEHLRRSLWAMLAALFAGALTGAVSGYGLVRVLGGSRVLALSMLPKSLTTPIAIEVSQTVGGLPSLTAVLAILAGVLVAVVVYPVVETLRMRDEGAIGLGAGTAGSGVGASRVLAVHPVSAAFAAVAIGLNGLITAVIAPVLGRMLGRW
jgi:putative effector of murein hydrolase